MRWFLVPATALLAACAKPVAVPPPAPLAADRTGVSEPAPIPPLDDRDYRILRLDNGLTAMLVSDPDTATTAAALSVRAGSYDEPDDRPGLAHFLEHMLFLGTETYPGAGAFDAYLARHGGGSNAWTDDEATLYYFSVSPSGFDGALHRLSRFFIDPSFDRKFVKKEVQAVESEYRLRIEERWWRWDAAVGQTVHPDHPARRFTTGSLETLSDRRGDAIIDDLRAFYDEYYTAQQMHLAVVGTHSLDTLEGQVRSWFAEVPRSDTPPVRRDRPPLYRDDQLGVRLDIQQREEVHSLRLEWPIPEQAGAWPEEPAGLLAHVLGDEGPGSLFAQLSDRNWLTSLSAGPTDGFDGGGDLFILDMDLTEEGAQHIDAITAACFAAIQTLREQPMPAHLAGEVEALTRLGFEFEAPMDPETLVEVLAEGMLDYPAEAVLGADLLKPGADPAQIAALLDLLTVDRLRMIVDGPELEEGEPAGEVQRAPYYGVPYRLRPLSPEEQARFTAGSDLEVKLPTVNPWIPTQTRMLTEQTAEQPLRVPDPSLEGVDIWTSPAAVWKTPRVLTRLTHSMSDLGVETPEEWAVAVMYARLLDNHLVDFAYPVELADSSYTFSIEPLRFRLSVEGWSDVQEALLDRLLIEAQSFVPEEEDFELQKAETLRKWRDYVHATPGDRVGLVAGRAVRPEGRDDPEWVRVLEEVSFADLTAFADSYWRPGVLQVVSYGNVDEAMSQRLAAIGARHLEVSPSLEAHHYRQVQWLPEGTERTLELEVDHDDSAISMIYMGSPGIEEWARWMLLGDLMAPRVFRVLRTQRQLGYDVRLHPFRPLRVPGMQLTIQSSVAGPSLLKERIDAFLATVPRRLEQMDAESFDSTRAALVEQLREPARSFDEGSRVALTTVSWMDTEQAYFLAAADALEQVTQEEVVELAERLFATDAPTRVVCWTAGRAHADDPLKGTAECRDRACLSSAMEGVFTMDFGQPGPADGPEPN